MRVDFQGRDYKSVDGLFVMMDTLEVYNLNGVLKGKLASADFPRTREGIMELLKSAKPPKRKPEPEPVVEKKGLSLHSMKNPRPVKKAPIKKTVIKAAKRKKKGR